MKKLKKLGWILLSLVVISAIIFFSYFNNASLVNDATVAMYYELKDSLESKGYKAKLLMVSGKRFKWHNRLLARYGAAKGSKHLDGDAMDFLVYDVNGDGTSDGKDVDIVYALLDQKIVRSKGGIGTYKNESSFFTKQMVHIDCREKRARWHR